MDETKEREVKFTDDERVRHDTRHVEGFSLAETILAERTEALAARLSQLEGSTRAALAKIEKALARHDGDLAELHGRATAIATGADDAIHAIHAKLAPLVASHVGMGEIVEPTERAIDDLAVVMEERDTARAERSVALVERDQARAALAEALVQRDGAMSDRSAFLHAGEQRALQLVEARAAIADLEARLAAMSRARDVCAVQRDALVGARDQCAAQRDEARAELHRVEQEIRAALARFDR